MRTSLKGGLGSSLRHRKDQAKDIPINVTAAQYRVMKKPARNKYGNKITVRDGIKFRSKREADRYSELKLLVAAGKIADLKLQPRFPLIVKGEKVGLMIADFRYREYNQKDLFAVTEPGSVIRFKDIVEDVKGARTLLWKLKWSLAMVLWPDINWRIV